MSAPTTAPPTKLYQALLAAQREMGPVLKNSTNPAFRSKYADLSSVLDTITVPLNAHGVLVLQRLGVSLDPTDLPLLTTELIHAESGQAIECCVRVVSKDPTDPQKFGGALTYYRRYSLLSLLGLAPEDDDGNAASQPARTPAPPQTRQNAPGATKAPMQVQSVTPAPPDAAQTAQTALPAAPPMTDAGYKSLFEQAWTMVEDGSTYLDVVAFVKRSRDRMTDAQFAESRDEVRLIRKAIEERDKAVQPAS